LTFRPPALRPSAYSPQRRLRPTRAPCSVRLAMYFLTTGCQERGDETVRNEHEIRQLPVACDLRAQTAGRRCGSVRKRERPRPRRTRPADSVVGHRSYIESRPHSRSCVRATRTAKARALSASRRSACRSCTRIPAPAPPRHRGATRWTRRPRSGTGAGGRLRRKARPGSRVDREGVQGKARQTFRVFAWRVAGRAVYLWTTQRPETRLSCFA
jgi:hypothetical protein